jgi:hypothetical protein
MSYEFLNNLEYELAIAGQPLRRYTVEVSCDLTRWLPLATTLADSRGIAYFRDKAVMSGASEAWCAPPAALALQTGKREAKTQETRFYRVVEAQLPEAPAIPRLKVRSPTSSK